MEAILYILIFIIGTLFGSFYTLAIHRIPKKQDILYTHSYCPNCNHKLGLLDLFPIFSYIFLRGKCRYCKEKIRPRYLIIETLSGILFVVIAFAMKMSIYNLTLASVAEFAFMVLYLTYIIIMCGLDRENRKVYKGVNIYGMAISIMYMLYLCIVEGATDSTSIYRYAIYLLAYVIIMIFDTVTLAEYAKSTYVDGILLSLVTMLVFTGEIVTIGSIVLTLLAMGIYVLIYKLNKNKNNKEKHDKISISFYLGVSNILVYTLILLISQYVV